MSSPPTPLIPNSRPSAVARWARDTFSRESIFAGIKTLTWLAPLTLLIWLYAERSQLATSPAETIPIDVRSSDPNRFYVRLMMQENDRSVVGELQGAEARIEQVIKDIAPRDNSPSVVLTIPTNQVGIKDLDAGKEISLSPIFIQNNVSVINCKPVTLKVYIDEFIEDDAEVKIRSDQVNQISSAVFTPAKVKVRGPSNDINAAKAKGPLVVYADFDASTLQVPGSHPDVAVRFQSDQLTGKPGVTFSHATVTASVEVRPSEFPGEVRGIPIVYLISPDLMNKYKVELTGGIKVLPIVPVIGPKDKVDELVNAQVLKAFAILPIKAGAEDQSQSAIPEIHLPDPSVRIDTAKYTPKEIYYTLSKRDPP